MTKNFNRGIKNAKFKDAMTVVVEKKPVNFAAEFGARGVKFKDL